VNVVGRRAYREVSRVSPKGDTLRLRAVEGGCGVRAEGGSGFSRRELFEVFAMLLEFASPMPASRAGDSFGKVFEIVILEVLQARSDAPVFGLVLHDLGSRLRSREVREFLFTIQVPGEPAMAFPTVLVQTSEVKRDSHFGRLRG
jgi:hypothetical protein